MLKVCLNQDRRMLSVEEDKGSPILPSITGPCPDCGKLDNDCTLREDGTEMVIS